MAVVLEKNQSMLLKNEDSKGLNSITVGLGWDPVTNKPNIEGFKEKKGFFDKLRHAGTVGREVITKTDIDCDAFAVLMKDGEQDITADTVCFTNKRHKTDAVRLSGDNLTGDGEGDDEQIYITLKRIPASYKTIFIGVNIYSAKSRNQTFGDIANAFIRVVDDETGAEICRFDLTNDSATKDEIAMILGRLDRTSEGWKFVALANPAGESSIMDIARGLKRRNHN